MTEETIASPDSLELRSKPLASARLSRKAVFTVIGVLALIMGVVIVNVSKGKTAKAAGQTVKELQPDLIDAKLQQAALREIHDSLERIREHPQVDLFKEYRE